MKAIIEKKKEGLYFIRFYNSDGMPCDTFVVEKIYCEEGMKVDMILEDWCKEVRG